MLKTVSSQLNIGHHSDGYFSEYHKTSGHIHIMHYTNQIAYTSIHLESMHVAESRPHLIIFNYVKQKYFCLLCKYVAKQLKDCSYIQCLQLATQLPGSKFISRFIKIFYYTKLQLCFACFCCKYLHKLGTPVQDIPYNHASIQ